MLEIVWGTAAWAAWREDLKRVARNGGRAPVHLLATRPQLEYVQQILLSGKDFLWGEPAFLFQGLVRAILESAPGATQAEVDARQLLGRYGSLAGIIPRVWSGRAGSLEVSRDLAALILECKRARLTAGMAASLKAGPYWDRFRTIFSKYEEFLARHGISDREDGIRRAVRSLQEGSERWTEDVPSLWIAGFSHFTQAQQQLIQRLVQRVPNCRIYYRLDGDPYIKNDSRSATLSWMRRLSPETSERRVDRQPVSDRHVICRKALHPRDEVRGLLEWLKQCRADGTWQGEPVTVIARNPEDYREWLQRMLRREGWQANLLHRLPLRHTATGSAIEELVRLAAGEINRECLIEALAHPGLSASGLLPRTGGHEDAEAMLAGLEPFRGWDALFARLQARIDLLGRRQAPADPWRGLHEDLLELKRRLPEWPPAASASSWAEWVARLAEEFFRPANGLEWEAGEPDWRAVRLNRMALAELMRQVEEWALLDSSIKVTPPRIQAHDFMRQLQEWLRTTIDLEPDQISGRAPFTVRLYEPAQAQGLHHDFLAVLGIGEGVYPKHFHSDWLLPDRERERLCNAGLPLETTSDLEERERLSFEDLLDGGGRRILLSAVGDEESEWPPWLKELAVNEGFHVRFEEAMRPPALELARPAPGTSERRLLQYRLLGFEQSAAWGWEWLSRRIPEGEGARIGLARRLAASREATGDWSEWDGNLAGTPAVERLAALFPPNFRYSVSQFNEYARCSFSFFCHYILGLQAEEEAEEGPEAGELGIMLHEALARFLSNHAGQRLERLRLPEYEQELDLALASAWEKHASFNREQQSRLWQIALSAWKRRLRHWLRREVEWMEERGAALRPWLQEWKFGLDGHPALTLLPEETGLSRAVAVRGIIDRIDRSDEGVFAVYDYKLGAGPRREAMLEGWEFQIPLYILAAGRLLPDAGRVAGGGYYSLSGLNANNGLWDAELREVHGLQSTVRSLAAREEMEELLQQTARRVGGLVRGIRQGDFRLRPHECPAYCAYRHICRIGAHGKTLRGEEGVHRGLASDDPPIARN